MFGRRATLLVDLDTGRSKPEKIVAEYMHTKKVDLEECQQEVANRLEEVKGKHFVSTEKAERSI